MVNKILFVDNEKAILSSYRRLFNDSGYELFTAECALKAIELLKKEDVDVIVSDQRMPQVCGVEFLKYARKYSPDSIRILCTAYADIKTAMDSINKGEVYRYITKPWNSNEIKSAIRDGIELRRLKKENENLLALTKKQNLELNDLNKNLEKKVQDQTKEILKMFRALKTLYTKLDNSFVNAVKVLVFASMIRCREKAIVSHIKNTTKFSKIVAQKLMFSDTEIKDIEISALLHDIGKIGIKDTLLVKPFSCMTSFEEVEYMKHPVLGQAMLLSIEKMKDVGVNIRHHHERWDGAGYPDHLIGNQIPICSRIISVATHYDSLMRDPLCLQGLQAMKRNNLLQKVVDKDMIRK